MNGFRISSQRVLTPEGIKPATVVVQDGKIVDVQQSSGQSSGQTSGQFSDQVRYGDFPAIDAGNLVIMPGVIDSHVHVNEPGRTEWEGFETATRAAAAGGITTIADMPLNSDPVTTTVAALEKKVCSTAGQLFVDVTLWGGVVPGNAGQLDSMIDKGVSGFKCFLIHSGIDDFPDVKESDLRQAMPILASRSAPLLVHAELECGEPCHWENSEQSYNAFLKSRPRRWENEAIKLMIDLCRETKCPVHIVHLSSSEALPLIESAKQEGLPLTVETCPHYLTFASEEIADGDPRFKCAPPIREKENREKLWAAVKKGTIDFIVSDHSPCTPELKFLTQGDLKKAWGGISSLQFGLSIIWTEASRRGASLEDVSKWMTANTSRFLKLDQRKGCIASGFDADLIVFDPEAAQKIEQAIIQHKHKVTPYDGRELKGVVKQTYVRGQKVFDRDAETPLPTPPAGQLISAVHSGSRK